MAIPCDIARIPASCIDKEVELRGLVIRCDRTGWFRLQEVHDDGGIMPKTCDCSTLDDAPVQEKTYVKVIGVVRVLEAGRRSPVRRISVRDARVTYITREEALAVTMQQRASWFTDAALKEISRPNAAEILQILRDHAVQEGFQVVHKKSLEENCITFRCHQHTFYGKDQTLNLGCNWKVSIYKSKCDKMYRVSSHVLHHDHYLDADLFVHLALADHVRELIRTLHATGCSINQIITVIKAQEGTCLSRDQVRNVLKIKRSEPMLAESQELEAYMTSTDGQCYILEKVTDDAVRHRQGVATFSKSELQNLRQFPDFVSIDPSFAPMTSDWIFIPLVVIGKHREILPAGMIFAANVKSGIFVWILRLLLTTLPCADRLQTLCSDDDTALDAAFTQILNMDEDAPDDDKQLKAKIQRLSRIICFWHKSQNFIRFLQTTKLTPEQKAEATRHFKLIGHSRSKATVDASLEFLCGISEDVRQYIEDKIKPKIQHFSKPYMPDRCFTCGYNTSSVSESRNSQIKREMGGRALTLVEMRELLDNQAEQANRDTRYVKGRKHHRKIPPEIADIIVQFRLTRTMADVLHRSTLKARQLEIVQRRGPYYVIKEKFVGNAEREELYTVHGKSCTCRKSEQVGMPCSHVICKFQASGRPLDSTFFSERWCYDNDEYEIPDPPNPEPEDRTMQVVRQEIPSTAAPGSSETRYVLLSAQANSVVQLGSHSRETYEIVMQALKNVEDRLLNGESEPRIVDDRAIRPGRKKGKRTKSATEH